MISVFISQEHKLKKWCGWLCMRCTCGLVFLPTLWGAGNNYISTVQTITKAAEEKKIVIQIFLSFVGVGLPTVKCNSIY